MDCRCIVKGILCHFGAFRLCHFLKKIDKKDKMTKKINPKNQVDGNIPLESFEGVGDLSHPPLVETLHAFKFHQM
jgi:hypothetical protein